MMKQPGKSSYMTPGLYQHINEDLFASRPVFLKVPVVSPGETFLILQQYVV